MKGEITMKFAKFCIIWLTIVLIVGNISGCNDNSFLSAVNHSDVKYNIKYLFDNETAEYAETNLCINEIGVYENGTVISLILPQISSIPEERLTLGYFLVENRRIYKFNLGYEEKLNKEDLNNRIKMESLIQGASIVCQDEPIQDTLSHDSKGWHQSLEVHGSKREYHGYNNQIETGYYESFVWDLEKGLVAYKSGFGAEMNSIELVQEE